MSDLGVSYLSLVLERDLLWVGRGTWQGAFTAALSSEGPVFGTGKLETGAHMLFLENETAAKSRDN